MNVNAVPRLALWRHRRAEGPYGNPGAGRRGWRRVRALVVGATLAGEVRVFRAATGEQIESIHGHIGTIRNCAFSPDGRRLLTTSVADMEGAKLWDVGTWQELLILKGTGRGGFWTADGDAIILGGMSFSYPIRLDERTQVWRAPSWEEIAAAEALDNAGGKRP